MKARILLAMLAVVGMIAVVGLNAADKADDPLAGVKCPVSGKAVKADTGVKYKDGEVYFCCMNCPKAFAANTAKFAAKANHQLAATGQYVEKVCPLTGRKLNDATAIDVSGVEVSFCCNGCKGKASKLAGAEQVDLIFADKAFDKGFVKAAKKDGAE